ncbi:glycoside hydrolase family 78 protein [Zopfia rhizophila CBS 207.26]|uniref:Glycoside hydrolase family 78 protein n=1 Tax=Zopfia rhizophila CBS 207.26 TaxID=1314779 RepID=A0A6A6ETV5_9PEZI|nr:glycoside hydrolase family 78 protein [Zopfia rhizophila CBS 207.26]
MSSRGHLDRNVNSKVPTLLETPVFRAGFFFLILYIIVLASHPNLDFVVDLSRSSLRALQSAPSTLLALSGSGWAKTQTKTIQYQDYVLAPASRTLHPVSVYKVNGTVSGAQSLVMGSLGSAVFHNKSALTLDYGKNIAGVVSLLIGDASAAMQGIGITFSESSLWISGLGSDATAESGIDEILWIRPTSPGTYTVSREHERGAFRYLSLVHNSSGALEVKEVTTYFTAMPHYGEDQLRSYTGYFHCDDELINRIWYAGAYTNQLCTIDAKHGNSYVHLDTVTSLMSGDSVPGRTWYNNFTITNGTSALVDGAKRDRLVFSADMVTALPGIVTSTYDLITVKNSLDSLFALQDTSTGQLPYVGSGYPLMYSATYHLYTLIVLADYYLYSGDIAYVHGLWEQYKLALNFSLRSIDDSGLMDVNSPHDWLRFGMGGHNIEANAILYHTLHRAIELANALKDPSMVQTWQAHATGIKLAANALLWDPVQGMYRDNETASSLMPQDGNVWAVLSNLTASASQIESISAHLAGRWTAFGAPAPEAGDAICPFVAGLELRAHLVAGNAQHAVDLVRKMWGYMLEGPSMTNSTLVEGYAVDGSLRYKPYSNDAKISHAHGWSTGPTSVLTFQIAGIQLLEAAGKTWRIEPSLGDLRRVEAGFATVVGRFKVDAARGYGTVWMKISFETPLGTKGSLSVEHPECKGLVEVQNVCGYGEQTKSIPITKKRSTRERIAVNDLEGGIWHVVVLCNE